VCMVVMMVALAGCVRHQWAVNERLPYPIANAIAPLLQDPERGGRFAAVLRTRAFLVAFAITVIVISWKACFAFGIVPFDIKTDWNLWSVFGGHPWTMMPDTHRVFTPTIWPSIVAIAFLLTGEIGFSLWFFFLVTQLGFLLLNLGGTPVTKEHLTDSTTGGFFMLAMWIVYLGRHYYLRLLMAAFGRGSDPTVRQAVPFVWTLLASMAGLVAFMAWYGAPVWAAIVTVLVILGVLILLARLVAEAGMPFIGIPITGGLSSLLVGIFGVGLGPGALVPLTLLATITTQGDRENLMPNVVNSHEIGERSGVGWRRLSPVLMVAAVVVAIVACAGFLWHAYHGEGVWRSSVAAPQGGVVDPVANAASDEDGLPVAAYGTGAGITLLLGLARSWLPWWPLHPIGFVMCATFALQRCWFAYFLGWLCKSLTLRYGGSRVYQKLKPAAIGIIAGEAVVQLVVVVIKYAVDASGGHVPYFLTYP